MSSQQNQLGRFLFEGGLLPNADEFDSESDDNLLVAIHRAWGAFEPKSVSAATRKRAERTRSWIANQIAQDAELVLLTDANARAGRWLGERLLWSPQGRPIGSQVGIASSRLGRHLDAQADWFTVFRAACSKINRGSDILLTAADTTPAPFVRRAAELFGVRVVSMECPRESETIQSWLTRIRKLEVNRGGSVNQAFVSPALPLESDPIEHTFDLSTVPVRDKMVVAMADRLLVFHVRKNGHLEKLVRKRLDDPTAPTASVFIALGEDLVDRELADDLLDQGAVGWVVLETLQRQASTQNAIPKSGQVPIVNLPSSEAWEWLTHCTRAQTGGWPDQFGNDYIDDLLIERQPTDHSAFASLRRIVDMRMLIAGSRVIRGDTGVVCFTAVPLRELPQLRSFRAHLARWDFEPYGICIRKEWLAERNCFPVRYGDDALWESLDASDRPFFQLKTSGSRRGDRAIDWSLERESRHVGNLDLKKLPPEAGLVFVPTLEEAERIATISPWPVTVLDRDATARTLE